MPSQPTLYRRLGTFLRLLQHVSMVQNATNYRSYRRKLSFAKRSLATSSGVVPIHSNHMPLYPTMTREDA
eukprot:961860-Amphidinium_carterae.1